MEDMARHDHPDCIRHGQHIFNSLYNLEPEIANKIRGTRFDPFYNDEKIPLFWCRLFELINGEEDEEDDISEEESERLKFLSSKLTPEKLKSLVDNYSTPNSFYSDKEEN